MQPFLRLVQLYNIGALPLPGAILVTLNKKKKNQLGKKEQRRKGDRQKYDRCRNEINNDHYGWKVDEFRNLFLLRSL